MTFSLKAQDAPVQASRGQWELDTDTNVSIFHHNMDTTHKGKSFPQNKALFTEKMPSGKKVSQERRGRTDKDELFKTDTSARPFHSRQKGYKL